jgi:sodium/bile acid cotransporter 7
MPSFAWLWPDKFTLALIATVLLASLLPISGWASAGLGAATRFAIAFVFFLHGARLSREAVLRGLASWRVHVAVFATTFVLFPLLGVLVGGIGSPLLPQGLAAGFVFLCCLPSTMQASVAFTSIAGGNVPAAVCSASISNLAGVFVTPLLIALVMGIHGGISPGSIEDIVLRILVPFILGQALHPVLGGWAKRHPRLLGVMDRGSILLVVFGAFSEAVRAGLWHRLGPESLAVMVALDAALLAAVLGVTTWMSRRLGFVRADEIAVVFCGSKKSLVAGVPMAGILFAGSNVGMILLPLMLFHQIQLMACAMLARHYAGRAVDAGSGEVGSFEPAE